MKTKLTITTLALGVASSALAIVGPGPRPEPKKSCLKVMKDTSGNYLRECDETRNNEKFGVKLLKNGCAKDQAVFASLSIEIPSCPDPRIVQL